MIADVIGLFVERVEPPELAQEIAATQSLLVVDACARGHHAAAMLRRLERLAPVSPRLVNPSELAAEEDVPRADRIWLLVDEDSDRTFCSLLRRDLERSRSAPARILTVGTAADEDCQRLEPAHVGRCKPWRRRRGLAEGARLAARLFAEEVAVRDAGCARASS